MAKKRIKIDEIKREAIRKAALALSQSELGRLSGVLQESINSYINENSQSMNYETWLRLLPYIKEHLPKDYIESIENDGNNFLNIIGYNHGTIVVHSIAGMTTEKEIKTILTKRILKSKKFNDSIKLEILELINEE